jgi:hypothetical protein
MEKGQQARKDHLPGTTEADPAVRANDRNPMESGELSLSKSIYSPASLKAAAARQALYPEVAEYNRCAIHNVSPVPRLVLDHLNGLFPRR